VDTNPSEGARRKKKKSGSSVMPKQTKLNRVCRCSAVNKGRKKDAPTKKRQQLFFQMAVKGLAAIQNNQSVDAFFSHAAGG